MSNVVWKTPDGFSKYLVSTDGRIRGPRAGELKQSKNAYGYSFVCMFSDSGERKTVIVHRLMGIVFLGARPGQLVRHLDDKKNNNTIENLAVGTYADNGLDRRRNNGYASEMQVRNDAQKSIIRLWLRLKSVEIYKQGGVFMKDVGRLFGISESAMSRRIKRQTRID